MEIRNEAGNVLIDLLADGLERVRYNHPDFPVYMDQGRLSQYPDYSGICHWHDDVEFFLVLDGVVHYRVNDEVVPLAAGDGIFVNARQLHYGFSPNHTDANFLCVLIPPLLFCSLHAVVQKYIDPIITNPSLPYLKLPKGERWAREVFSEVREIYNALDDPAMELLIESLFYRIWLEIYRHGIGQRFDPERRGTFEIESMKYMVTFIREHHEEPIRLSEIAAAGRVGKTTCCRIFKKYMNTSPGEYLLSYRLRKGAQLLADTDHSITEISEEAGFSGASYFAEMFKRQYGMSPSEYRKGAEVHG